MVVCNMVGIRVFLGIVARKAMCPVLLGIVAGRDPRKEWAKFHAGKCQVFLGIVARKGGCQVLLGIVARQDPLNDLAEIHAGKCQVFLGIVARKASAWLALGADVVEHALLPVLPYVLQGRRGQQPWTTHQLRRSRCRWRNGL
jgi:hypothetical protein